MVNSVDPDQTAPLGAVCSGSTMFASILNLSVMLGNYLQQTTSANDIFRCIFCFLGALISNICAQASLAVLRPLLLVEYACLRQRIHYMSYPSTISHFC